MGGLQGGGKGDPKGGSTVDTEGFRGVHMPPSGLHVQRGDLERATKAWEGSAIPRTIEGDEAHYTAFLLGTPSSQGAGCSVQRTLKLPHAWVLLCILHLTMAMGRLLEEFVAREARESPLRSGKTYKSSYRRGVQVGAFIGQLPRTGKKRPISLRHARILLGALASGRARPSTRPSRTRGTCCRPSIVHIRAPTRYIVPRWQTISNVTLLLVQHHGIDWAWSMM